MKISPYIIYIFYTIFFVGTYLLLGFGSHGFYQVNSISDLARNKSCMSIFSACEIKNLYVENSPCFTMVLSQMALKEAIVIIYPNSSCSKTFIINYEELTLGKNWSRIV